MKDDSDLPPGAPELETLEEPSGGDRSGSATSSASLDGGRFAPGTLLDSRFRIVGLLGRGGMGEVYRAEDLKLGETVALKFLPRELAGDGAALSRLHREVRTARGVTHKNVVRVHDVGEADGLPFIAMEYVDGENLASLLQRIGRLPGAKALELARQLCAGLAAAHERGVLHRDLKPANVMIDGRGEAKISDFGLAGLAADLEQPEIAGTPLYMAPEQLAEGKVSFASDIYSLGLVLFEMFSGTRPFRAGSRAELVAEHRDAEPPSLSAAISSVDPLVESAIGQCLARRPADRPSSPLAVAAALPGGDPLAAALAAGETPSPEMVARASGQAALSPPLAAALLALAAASALITVWLQHGRTALGFDPPLPAQVLAHRATEVLDRAGWRGTHAKWGFRYDDYRVLLDSRRERSLEGWREEAERRPSLLTFWYRSSARPIVYASDIRGRVDLDDPPLATAGVATVRLDGRGRLRTLLLPPAAVEHLTVAWAVEAPAGGGAPDWESLFADSGLDPADFKPVAARRGPPYWAERLHAWEGTYPGQEEPRVVVDAASTAGRVAWWRLTEAPLLEVPGARLDSRGVPYLGLAVFALIIFVGGWLAYRHLRSGRGDRRSATRLGLAMGAAYLTIWLLVSDQVATPRLFVQFNQAVALAALLALAVWLLYMAVEPFARRLLPRRLTSWARLLRGGFGDPLVGRDLLIGIAAYAATLAVNVAWLRTQGSVHWSFAHGFAPLEGPARVAANAISILTLLVPMSLFAILVVVRAAVRSDRWAPWVFFTLLLGIYWTIYGLALPSVLSALCLAALGAYVGLLGLVGFAVVTINLNLVPVSLDPSLWWAKSSWIGLAAVLALAAWSARTAIRPAIHGGGERPAAGPAS